MPTPKKPAGKAKASAKAAPKPITKPLPAPMPVVAQPESTCCSTSSCCSSTSTSCCGGGSCGGLLSFCPVFEVVSTLKFWVGSLVAFVVVFFFQGFWHGTMLMDDYLATAAMWRSNMDINLFYLSQVLTALILTALVQLMGKRGWWGGTVSGVLASLPFTVGALMSYITMPFEPGHIPTMWAIGDVLQGALVGLALTATFRCPLVKSGCKCGPDCACGPTCDC